MATTTLPARPPLAEHPPEVPLTCESGAQAGYTAAASRPVTQEVFIGISKLRVSRSSALETRDSACDLGALARVLCGL